MTFAARGRIDHEQRRTSRTVTCAVTWSVIAVLCGGIVGVADLVPPWSSTVAVPALLIGSCAGVLSLDRGRRPQQDASLRGLARRGRPEERIPLTDPRRARALLGGAAAASLVTAALLAGLFPLSPTSTRAAAIVCVAAAAVLGVRASAPLRHGFWRLALTGVGFGAIAACAAIAARGMLALLDLVPGAPGDEMQPVVISALLALTFGLFPTILPLYGVALLGGWRTVIITSVAVGICLVIGTLGALVLGLSPIVWMIVTREVEWWLFIVSAIALAATVLFLLMARIALESVGGPIRDRPRRGTFSGIWPDDQDT